MTTTVAGTVFVAGSIAQHVLTPSELAERFFADVDVDLEGITDVISDAASAPVVCENPVVGDPSIAHRTRSQPVRSVAS
jgi:hypothetical protein